MMWLLFAAVVAGVLLHLTRGRSVRAKRRDSVADATAAQSAASAHDRAIFRCDPKTGRRDRW
jgi:hypothetical protein